MQINVEHEDTQDFCLWIYLILMRTKLTALILTIFLKTCSLSGAGQKVLPLAVLHSSVNDEQFSWICLIISAVQILRCITDWKINSCTLQHFGKKRCIKYDSVTV